MSLPLRLSPYIFPSPADTRFRSSSRHITRNSIDVMSEFRPSLSSLRLELKLTLPPLSFSFFAEEHFRAEAEPSDWTLYVSSLPFSLFSKVALLTLLSLSSSSSRLPQDQEAQASAGHRLDLSPFHLRFHLSHSFISSAFLLVHTHLGFPFSLCSLTFYFACLCSLPLFPISSNRRVHQS